MQISKRALISDIGLYIYKMNVYYKIPLEGVIIHRFTNIKKILYGLIMWFESEKSFCRFFVDSSKQWRCTKSWMMAIVILLLITVLYTSIIYLIMFLVVRASSQQLLMLWFVLTTSMYNYLHWPVHLNGSHPTFTAFYGNVDIKWICWGPTVIIWIM